MVDKYDILSYNYCKIIPNGEIVMTKSMVAVITAVITAVVSVCSTLVVVKYTGNDGTEKEAKVEVFYDDENGADNGFEPYELSGGQQTVEGDISEYDVQIKSARIARNWDNKECVVITYVSTNNSGEAESFGNACDDAVYQNGVALEITDSGSDASLCFDGYNHNDVKSGASYEFNIGYVINDKTAPLEVVVSDNRYYSEFSIYREFYLS